MSATPGNATFPRLRFVGKLRDSQKLAVKVIQKQLQGGNHRLHIVAPPGSGKTVLGLYVWAEMVRRPAFVLSPNSAIQAQWAARTSMFKIEPTAVSTDPKQPGLLTSLTYQSVTMPKRGDDDLDAEATNLWRDKLIEAEQAEDPDEAQAWIDDLRANNPKYHDERLAAYRKQVRDALALGGEAMATLHGSSLQTLGLLRDAGVGLIILDECHHLMGHWGRVLADVHDTLDDPVVLGLTATPPERGGRKPEDIARYDSFFGPIDFEVPVPALVKERNLAPYQDLAYFVRPGSTELSFIARADEAFREVVEELCAEGGGGRDEESERRRDEVGGEVTEGPRDQGKVEGDEGADKYGESNATSSASDTPATSDTPHPIPSTPPMPRWLHDTFRDLRLPTGKVKDWRAFVRRDKTLADMGRVFLLRRGEALPDGIPEPPIELIDAEIPEMELLVPVMDRYIRHGLRRSRNKDDHALADRAIARLRMLGVQITETGSQACASPVGRVMAYARGKAEALVNILKAERRALGSKIRAVVVTDYEKTSAVTAETASVLDEEAGGAIAAFRMLLTDDHTDALNPVLVTGSTLLVDDDLLPAFMEQAKMWLKQGGFDVDLNAQAEDGFHVVSGRGGDWCPRVYVAMVTELFQRGVTRCLVGTRGLLGEGWDANKTNVLIDLTTVTTSMTVNQLRGRSMRLDPEEKQKVANNWDVVCVADEFTKGLDDYARFRRKHGTLYGVTDDGAIEKGVGHVHAAFTELKPEGISGAMNLLNADMLERAGQRDRARSLWKIGEPFNADATRSLELKMEEAFSMGFPPFAMRNEPWTDQSLTASIGRAILESMVELKLITSNAKMQAGQRESGYVRLFLRNASLEESERFIHALHEAIGPLHRPRYVIPRSAEMRDDTWISRLLPEIVAKYLRRKRMQQMMLHAVPSDLAKNKDVVSIFERHWNLYVSPGEAMYAYQGEGERLVAEALKKGQTPRGRLHHKDVYV